MHNWQRFTRALARRRSVSGVVWRLRGGPLVWLGRGGNDTELLLHYSGQVGYESGQISVLGGLTGRAVVTEGDANLGERTLHQLGAAMAFGSGTVRPGFHVRLPVDRDLTDILDFVFGFNVAIELRSILTPRARTVAHSTPHGTRLTS